MQEHVEALLDLEVVEHRLDQVQIPVVMQHAAVRLPVLIAGHVQRAYPDLLIIPRRDGAISIHANGRGEDATAMLINVRGDVGAASREADAQRRLRSDDVPVSTHSVFRILSRVLTFHEREKVPPELGATKNTGDWNVLRF
jgi:hypothetical protein